MEVDEKLTSPLPPHGTSHGGRCASRTTRTSRRRGWRMQLTVWEGHANARTRAGGLAIVQIALLSYAPRERRAAEAGGTGGAVRNPTVRR